MKVWCEEGDLFGTGIEEVSGFNQYGEDWGLWGRWVYTDDGLIALFSRAYGKNAKPKAYAIREGYEKIVEHWVAF